MGWVDNCWWQGSCVPREVFRLPRPVLDVAYRKFGQTSPVPLRCGARASPGDGFFAGMGPLMQAIQRQLGADFGLERRSLRPEVSESDRAWRRALTKMRMSFPAWEGLGFGFAEVGTITAKAQPGKPKPRLFRVPEVGGVINRMGSTMMARRRWRNGWSNCERPRGGRGFPWGSTWENQR
jgi:hypothetical protein